jgi:uncharacterized protein (DUF2249 family)
MAMTWINAGAGPWRQAGFPDTRRGPSMSDPATQTHEAPAYTPHPFDARGIARRFRHSAIFGALGALQPGEAMRFVNDHDPLPLLDQLRDRFGSHVEIVYRQREPGAIVIDFVIKA